MKTLIGTGVAMVTPFKTNGEVDVPALIRLTHSLIDGRIDAGGKCVIGRFPRVADATVTGAWAPQVAWNR